MAKTRTVTEYRLLIQRKGNAVKDWRARSLKAVERRIGLLTSPEPWRFYSGGHDAAKGPDDYVCCADGRYDECGCGGLTMSQHVAEKRKDLPPIESIRVQQRQVITTAWEPMESATPVNAGATTPETGAPESAPSLSSSTVGRTPRREGTSGETP